MMKIALALYVMAIALWFSMGAETDWTIQRGWARFIHLAWMVPVGAVSYFGTLWLLGFRLKDFAKRSA
jgi:putative peptidoglycan lipid II flippase